MIHKLEQVFGIARQRARKQSVALREPSTRKVHGVDRVVFCQRLDYHAPGERIRHETVDQEQRRTAAGMLIAPAQPVNYGKAFFHAINTRSCWYRKRWDPVVHFVLPTFSTF